MSEDSDVMCVCVYIYIRWSDRTIDVFWKINLYFICRAVQSLQDNYHTTDKLITYSKLNSRFEFFSSRYLEIDGGFRTI